MLEHRTVRAAVLLAITAAALTCTTGCQSVKITHDKRIAGFTKKSLQDRGVILLVKVDHWTEGEHPGLTRAMWNTFTREMKDVSVVTGRDALAVAAAYDMEPQARKIAESFQRMQTLDRDAFAAVAPKWREAFGSRYIVVVAVSDPFTFRRFDKDVDEKYDYKKMEVEESTTTTTWTSGTKTVIRLFAVPVDKPVVACRLYAEGVFTNVNEQTRRHDSDDSFGQALLGSLLDSLGDDPREYPDAPSGQNSAAKTLIQMLARLNQPPRRN